MASFSTRKFNWMGAVVIIGLTIALGYIIFYQGGQEEARIDAGMTEMEAEPIAPTPETVSPDAASPSSPASPSVDSAPPASP